MRWIPFVCMAGALGFAPDARAEDKPVLTNDLKNNVRAVLVGARLSETRGRHLIARFETAEKPSKVVEVGFPAHSFSTHEQTLRAVIQSCVDWEKPDKDGWARPQAEAIFSIPPDGGKQETGAYSRLEKFFLVSLRLTKGN